MYAVLLIYVKRVARAFTSAAIDSLNARGCSRKAEGRKRGPVAHFGNAIPPSELRLQKPGLGTTLMSDV